MADDPNRYDEVPGGHLYLKAGQVPDQPYTETIAKNRASKDRELLDSLDGALVTIRDEMDALAVLPPGGVAGDFLTRTATGFRWMPPVMDLGDVIVDVSGLYFIDNGDGTSTPAHPELFVDNADGTSTLKGA